MDLIEELLKKINSNNSSIIMGVANVITSNKIKNIDDLLEYEDKKFMINGKKISKKEQVQHCIDIINSFPYEYDELDFDEIKTYKKYKKIIDDSTSSLNDKILSLIIIFNLTKREMYFPYEAYRFIINSDL